MRLYTFYDTATGEVMYSGTADELVAAGHYLKKVNVYSAAHNKPERYRVEISNKKVPRKKVSLPLVDKPCEICGAMMHQVKTSRRICPECFAACNGKPLPKKKKKEKRMTLEERSVQQKESGISYGMRMAMEAGYLQGSGVV